MADRVRYDFSGLTALVTGGASGIGLASAQALASAGARVAIADLNLDAAREAVARIEGSGGTAACRAVDVAKPGEVEAMVEWVIGHFGSLDIAHNNAGIEGENVALVDWSTANWLKLIDVNLNSVFHCLKAELRHMVGQGSGSIINTASISGLIGGFNQSAYIAAKHGVVGLTKAAAMDYATKGVRVNAICPGLIDTPFVAALPQAFRDRLDFGTPMTRPGKAEEVADAVLWLASDTASYVTGQAIAIDGATALGGIGTRFDDLL